MKLRSKLYLHLKDNTDYCFIWTFISIVLKINRTWKNFEVSCIVLWKPDPTEHKDFEILF